MNLKKDAEQIEGKVMNKNLEPIKNHPFSKFWDIKNDALHFFMHLVHNFAFFLFLGISALIMFDIYQNNSAVIKFILSDNAVSYLEDSGIENKSTLIIFYLALPISFSLSIVASVFYFLNRKKIEKERTISTKISNNIFASIFYFIIGFIYPAITYLGGGILTFKILGLLSSQQVMWLSIIQISIISEVFALITAQISVNIVQFFLSVRKTLLGN